jgi:hypothetical protein
MSQSFQSATNPNSSRRHAIQDGVLVGRVWLDSWKMIRRSLAYSWQVDRPRDYEKMTDSYLQSWLITNDLDRAEDLIEAPFFVKDAGSDAALLSQSVERYDQLVQCYILGNTLQAFNFQNAAMDLILEVAYDRSLDKKSIAVGYAPYQVTIAYKNTLPGAPLRRVLVDGVTALTKEELQRSIPDITSVEGEEYAKDLLIEPLIW